MSTKTQEDRRTLVSRVLGQDFKPRSRRAGRSDIRFEYSLHGPCPGRDQVREFATTFRAAFPDLNFWAPPRTFSPRVTTSSASGGWGPHTGGRVRGHARRALPAASGKAMHSNHRITVLKVEDGLITEELGLDDGVTVLQQLGLIKAA